MTDANESIGLQDLWNTLCIDSIGLTDMEFIEVGQKKNTNLKSNHNIPEMAMSLTAQEIIDIKEEPIGIEDTGCAISLHTFGPDQS